MLVEMTFEDYLRLVSGSELNLDIQRRVITGFKPYEKLRQDLTRGCLIPAPVLAIQSSTLPPPEKEVEFATALAAVKPDDVYIVDGLQRTNAIQQVAKGFTNDAARNEWLTHKLRVEVWPDISISSLTYRMILLNAGQKPMSLRHQLEVVSRPLCDALKQKFGSRLEIYRERDVDRRSSPGQYQFSLIASAFQAYVQKRPHIDLRNEVVEELNQLDALDTYASQLDEEGAADPTSEFMEYVGFLISFDDLLCRRYPDRSVSPDGDVTPSGKNLLTRDTFHLGLAAAYAWCRAHKREALEKAVQSLLKLMTESDESDCLALARLEKIQAAFKRKDNVGEQTRNLIFRGFQEYFRSEGLTPFEQCWLQS